MEKLPEHPLVSIIMPAYNAEKTIERAINSVLCQSYHNFELIVVNDGSADQTQTKIEKIQDKRIIIYNQDNKGLSAARNTGMERARGDIVGFIDSDDWYDKNYLSQMVRCMVLNNAEVVVCGIAGINSEKITKAPNEIVFERLWENSEFIATMQTGVMNSVCNKLYRVELIRRHNLSFKNFSILEDFYFNVHYFDFTNHVVYTTIQLYHYDTSSSVLTTKVSEDMLENYVHLHALLLGRLPITLFPVASQCIYHQYLSLFLKYAKAIERRKESKKDVVRIYAKYFENPLVRYAFKVARPKVATERLMVFLLRCGLYRVFLSYLEVLRALA